MSENGGRIRAVLITYFPMFIATLSLCTSMFNGYINTRFLDFIERNTGRTEYMRTCKEIIDAYFQVKFRAGLVSAAAERARTSGAVFVANSPEAIDGQQAVNRFGALGTYLANLRDEAVRQKYTDLTDELTRIMNEARNLPAGELDRQYEKADQIFTDMNNDCVRSARDLM